MSYKRLAHQRSVKRAEYSEPRRTLTKGEVIEERLSESVQYLQSQRQYSVLCVVSQCSVFSPRDSTVYCVWSVSAVSSVPETVQCIVCGKSVQYLQSQRQYSVLCVVSQCSIFSPRDSTVYCVW